MITGNDWISFCGFHLRNLDMAFLNSPSTLKTASEKSIIHGPASEVWRQRDREWLRKSNLHDNACRLKVFLLSLV